MRIWYICFIVGIIFCLLVFPVLRDNSLLLPCFGEYIPFKITSICNYFSNIFFESVGNALIGILLALWLVEGYIRRKIEEKREGIDLLTNIDWVVWAWQGGSNKEFHIDVLNSRLMIIDVENDTLTDETKVKFALLANKAVSILRKKSGRISPNLNAALKALIKLKKEGENIGGSGFHMMSVKNDTKKQEILQEFESKKNESVVLIVNSTNAPDKWTIAGFNDEGQFKRVVIDDPNNELSVEMKKKSANESKIVELVTLSLGRTLLYNKV